MNLLEQIKDLHFPAPLPSKLLAVTQRFDAPKCDDIQAATYKAVDKLAAVMSAGDTVAVGAGSRGIANLPLIVRSTVDRLKELGMKPFVIPTMGSHGGATAAGQLDVLANLGVTPESIGVEFKATMEV